MVVETTLFDVKSRRIVWGGTSETVNPTSIEKDAPGLASLIIGALRKRGLLHSAK